MNYTSDELLGIEKVQNTGGKMVSALGLAVWLFVAAAASAAPFLGVSIPTPILLATVSFTAMLSVISLLKTAHSRKAGRSGMDIADDTASQLIDQSEVPSDDPQKRPWGTQGAVRQAA